MTIKRDKYLNDLIRKKDNGMVKIITGIRRSGKSFLLFNLFYNYLIESGVDPENIICLSLEDIENIKLWNLDNFHNYLNQKIRDDNKKYYLLIDEIQLVKSKIDDNTNEIITFHHSLLSLIKKADVYVTGSNSKMLSNDIITEFRGRGDIVHIYPLTFKEYYSIHKSRSVDDVLSEYCFYGGLPQVAKISNIEDKTNYFKNIFNLVYNKDIIERYNLRSEKILIDPLLDILASNIGSLTNSNRLCNIYNHTYKEKSNSKTIKRYIDYFIDSFIISCSNRYDIKGNKLFDTPQKYYFSDIGLRNARLNFNQVDLNHIIENIIYNELLYRGFNVNVGVISTFEKNKDQKTIRKNLEIDFVATKFNEKIYIQFAESINSNEKYIQETRGFNKISDSFKKILIVKDQNSINFVSKDGIKLMSVKSFLLE